MSMEFLTIRLKSEVKQEIIRIAEQERRSNSQVALMLLEAGLRAKKQNGDKPRKEKAQ